MPQYRIAETAELLGVSDDSIRRWIEHGKLPAGRDQSKVEVVEGADLTALPENTPTPRRILPRSAARPATAWWG